MQSKIRKYIRAASAFSFVFLFVCGGCGEGDGGYLGVGNDQVSEGMYGVTLSLQPEAQDLEVGNAFMVEITLNTENEAVTAVSAYLMFPQDLIEIQDIYTADSSFSIHVETTGENNSIKITCGEPSPGVNASNAVVARIELSAKEPGIACLEFILDEFGEGPSRVISADGLGTDILDSVAGACYTIK
jgi:hypothetical protein